MPVPITVELTKQMKTVYMTVIEGSAFDNVLRALRAKWPGGVPRPVFARLLHSFIVTNELPFEFQGEQGPTHAYYPSMYCACTVHVLCMYCTTPHWFTTHLPAPHTSSFFLPPFPTTTTDVQYDREESFIHFKLVVISVDLMQQLKDQTLDEHTGKRTGLIIGGSLLIRLPIDADAKAMFDGSTGCKGNPASFDQSTLAVAVSAQAYVCKDEKVIEAIASVFNTLKVPLPSKAPLFVGKRFLKYGDGFFHIYLVELAADLIPAATHQTLLHGHPNSPLLLGPAGRGCYGHDIDLSIQNLPALVDVVYRHHKEHPEIKFTIDDAAEALPPPCPTERCTRPSGRSAGRSRARPVSARPSPTARTAGS